MSIGNSLASLSQQILGGIILAGRLGVLHRFAAVEWRGPRLPAQSRLHPRTWSEDRLRGDGQAASQPRVLSEWIVMFVCSMPQDPHEAHRRRVRAGNIAPASLTLNPFQDSCHSSLAVLVCRCIWSQCYIYYVSWILCVCVCVHTDVGSINTHLDVACVSKVQTPFP